MKGDIITMSEEIERMLNAVARCVGITKDELKYKIYNERRVYYLKEDIKDDLFTKGIKYNDETVNAIAEIYDRIEDSDHSYWSNLNTARDIFFSEYLRIKNN